MPILEQQSVLTGLQVRDAMRRNVHRLGADARIGDCIRRMIKYKCNAVLVVESTGKPVGVVSKTDLMGAYYADLPLESALGDIMAGPPRFCYPDDGLEEALDLMQQNGIHRLYVLGAEPGEIAGVLALRILSASCTATAASAPKVFAKPKNQDRRCPVWRSGK